MGGEERVFATRVNRSVAGELFDLLAGPSAIRYLADNRIQEIGVDLDDAFIAGSGPTDVLIVSNNAFMLPVNGGWQVVANATADRFGSAAKAFGTWWAASPAGLFKFSSITDSTKIELKGMPFAVVNAGPANGSADELLVAHGDGSNLLVSAVDAAGVTKEVDRAPLSARVLRGEFMRNANGWLALGAKLSLSSKGAVWLRAPGKKFARVAKAASLVGLDDYDRLWFTRDTNVVVRDATGKEQAYPLASKQMFTEAFAGLRCLPIGKGFDVLPGAAAAATGNIRLHVKGAGAWPFEACKELTLSARSPCAGQPDRVSGTLDADGRWNGPAPIGMYSFAVRRDNAWLTPDYSGGGNAFCHVSTDRDCIIEFFMK